MEGPIPVVAARHAPHACTRRCARRLGGWRRGRGLGQLCGGGGRRRWGISRQGGGRSCAWLMLALVLILLLLAAAPPAPSASLPRLLVLLGRGECRRRRGFRRSDWHRRSRSWWRWRIS